MKWVSKRLFGSGAKPDNPPPTQRATAAPLAGDTIRLRRTLASAASETERIQAADALGSALGASSEQPQAADPVEVWVSAICHAADKALAKSWLERLAGGAGLAEVAVRSHHSEVRLAAARRVEDADMLERIAERSRNKDKSVYRHCSAILQQRRRSDKRARRAQELAGHLEDLLAQVPISLSRLLDLEKELGALAGGDTSPAEVAALALLEQARARLQAESLLQRELNTALAAAKLLLGECRGEAWPDQPQCDAWRTRLAALCSVQARLPAWLAGHSAVQQLATLLSEIAARMTSLAVDSERLSACEQFLAALDGAGDHAVPEKALWEALAKPEHGAARMHLELRWQQLLAASAAVVAHPAAAKMAQAANADTANECLDRFEKMVAEGNLAGADAMHRELSAVLAGTALNGSAEARFQRISAQLNELRGWARWSQAQAREQLLAQAEELLARPRKISELAEKIPALRAEWKRIDAFGPAGKEHWRRFDSALTAAYQPVAAHRAEVAARRAEARAAQEALCCAWESEFAAIAWEGANYPQIELRRGEMQKEWRAAVATSRREHGLCKRFDKLIGAIDQRLAAARTAEAERCEKLIAAAQKLEEFVDVERAATRIKELQEQWTKQRSPLRLDRRVEQILWLRFRAACDAVFARREASRTSQVAQREEQLQARRQVLDAFTASLDGTDVKAINYALAQALSDLAAGDKSRSGSDSSTRRANELTQAAQRRIETLARQSCRAQYQLLAKKAQLAEQIETAAAASTATELLEAARRAWDELPKLPAKAETMLAERFMKAPSALADHLAAGRDTKDNLLLDLEIALGLPSPAASAERRRRRQLEKLQKRFGGDASPPIDAAAVVIAWHAIAAAPDPDLDARMAAVLNKLEDLAAAAKA